MTMSMIFQLCIPVLPTVLCLPTHLLLLLSCLSWQRHVNCQAVHSLHHPALIRCGRPSKPAGNSDRALLSFPLFDFLQYHGPSGSCPCAWGLTAAASSGITRGIPTSCTLALLGSYTELPRRGVSVPWRSLPTSWWIVQYRAHGGIYLILELPRISYQCGLHIRNCSHASHFNLGWLRRSCCVSETFLMWGRRVQETARPLHSLRLASCQSALQEAVL
jgi:hypothetical protein